LKPFYLDASAVMKLIFAEPQSDALKAMIVGRDVAASELLLTEVPRAVHRLTEGMGPDERRYFFGQAGSTLSHATLLQLDRPTLELAGRFQQPDLRSLDAIHVATAVIAGDDLEAFVTYDRRQERAAREAGFEVLAPGL